MPAPSLVLDTNVVVSAHLNADGYERFVLDLALGGKAQLSMSVEIFEEYREVLSRAKFAIHPARLATSLELIGKAANRVHPRRRLKQTSDPEDNKFLECAEEAEADYLVTGNKRHFPQRWGKTRVVNARQFVEELIPGIRR
jgi:uncharacterized protein